MGRVSAEEGRQFTAEEKALLEKHFPSHRDGPKKRGEPGTFEVALVLAGGASGGAYTAGVLDFLIEALDEWNLRKVKDREEGLAFTDAQKVPHHEVIVRIMTGTSAGGRNAAIAAVLLNYQFPHIYDKAKFAAIHPGQEQNSDKNLFYSIWVKRADIESMLDTADLKKGALKSVFNDLAQDEMTDEVVNYEGASIPRGMRDWLANPYQLRLTNVNLRGVPFAYELRAANAGADQGFRLYADQLAFAVEAPSLKEPESAPPDCIVLSTKKPRTDVSWQTLKEAALSTGAAPVVFRARNTKGNPAHYLWRDSYFDMEQKAHLFVDPAWPGNKLPETYDYAAVDGGVMNRVPFELARKSLAGARGHNEQSGLQADRAVILIDPIVSHPKEGPSREAGLLKVVASLILAYFWQAQLSAQDLLQVLSPDVYSRFMIAPTRTVEKKKYSGRSALATGALGVFFGFFSRPHRHHDYLLGRRNAQKFLKTVFTLPAENGLFGNGRWSDKNREEFGDRKRTPELQIIPVGGDADLEEPAPAWPRCSPTVDEEGAYGPRREKIAALIKSRAYALGGMLPGLLRESIRGGAKGKGFVSEASAFVAAHLAGAWLWVGWRSVRALLTRKITEVVDAAATRTDDLA